VLTLGAGVGSDAVTHSIGQLVARWETDEAAEGIAAFFGKRKPAWVK
jgi:methylglutaconyl-CoA hydratase